MATSTRSLVGLGLLALLLVSGNAYAEDGPAEKAKPKDTVDGTTTTRTDEEKKFEADGTLQTKDLDGLPGLDGPPYTIPGPAAPHWTFSIKHMVRNWNLQDNKRGANSAAIAIEGKHITAPCKEKNEKPNQELPEVSNVGTPIEFGKSAALCVANRVRHKRTDKNNTETGEGCCWDHYAVEQEQAWAAQGPNRLVGKFKVQGLHRKDKTNVGIDEAIYITMAATTQGGTTLCYSAEDGRILLSIGAIDVLNAQVDLTAGIDPAYVMDPVRAGHLMVTPLHLMGQEGDGRFRFSGGRIELVDPACKFTFTGGFGGYLIDNTTCNRRLTSFAILDQLSITDVADSVDVPSAFLRDFVDVNIFGTGVPDREWEQVQGNHFTFVTDYDLVDLTHGFTTSVMDLPVTVVVSCSMTALELKREPQHARNLGRSILTGIAPNPVTSQASCNLDLPYTARVLMQVCDVSGRVVKTLVDGDLAAGRHAITWNPAEAGCRRLANGVYYLRLNTGTEQESRRFLLIR